MTPEGLCLTCGTSLERIAAESLTRDEFGFVPRDIWDQHLEVTPHQVSDTLFWHPLGAAKPNAVLEQDSVESQARTSVNNEKCGGIRELPAVTGSSH